MKFNADKTEEVIFSSKRLKPTHPSLFLGGKEVTGKEEHKHLGMLLDSKLDFWSHTKEAIVWARRGVVMIRYLSKYVSRDVLDQIYKLYVRPHLDYGDIIYPRDDPQMQLNFTQRLEQTQCLAALAVTGAWRSTSSPRLYDELGWETLSVVLNTGTIQNHPEPSRTSQNQPEPSRTSQKNPEPAAQQAIDKSIHSLLGSSQRNWRSTK